MAYKITTIQKQTYVHFIVEGENATDNTTENTLDYIKEIYNESTANNYKRILIEERLEGPFLKTMEIYDIISTVSQEILGFFKAIAYVDVKIDQNTVEFIENLAVNRALPLRAFSTVKKAEEWLTSTNSKTR